MSGASDRTRRVNFVNANWAPPHTGARRDQKALHRDRQAGPFEVLIVTEDEERHVVDVPPDQMAALLALIAAAGVLLWDPDARTLIAANLVGEWLPASYSTLAT